LQIPCIGIYSGLFGINWAFGSWMHEKYSLSVQMKADTSKTYLLSQTLLLLFLL
jgi:hypothetical protein